VTLTNTRDDILDITDLDPDLVLVKPEQPKPPKKRKRNVEWGGALIGLLAGVSGVLAGRLGHIWPAFDVFAQFTPQFFFLTAAFVVATFIPKRKAFVGLVLTAVMCVGYGLWAQASVGPVAKGPWELNSGERALRVAHFNLFFHNDRLDDVETEIARLDADVMTLIEFTPDKLALLPKLRAQFPYQFECSGEPNCHLAIISKFPFAGVESKGSWEGPPYIAVRMDGALQGLTVYGIHTTRFPHSRAQLHQITAMVRHLEATSGKLILMGDFNATPYSRITSLLEQGLGVARLTNKPTWPSFLELPQLAIDHIFASKGMRVLEEQQLGKASGSDHYPIVMTLGIDLQ
jgi:endonuclease/exonuclease/phosphatase (EEP) superfamily protein YafD